MRILVVSPHYDDAPLSLGQSMLDGDLAPHDVTVGVVFGRSSWVRWFHPTRRRAPIATAIRRAEEGYNARRFGYRVRVADREEALLRLDTLDPAVYLDPTFDPASSDELDATERVVAEWASAFDATLVPLGIGDHVDHRIVAAAGVRLAARGMAVGFYVDRPYASLLDDGADEPIAAQLGLALTRVDASGPITAEKTRRLFYPSQFDQLFVGAMANDQTSHRREVVHATDRLRDLAVIGPR